MATVAASSRDIASSGKTCGERAVMTIGSGLDFWVRDQHLLAEGEETGAYPAGLSLDDCGC
ncbi:hypothetical protein [Ewingella americana]|uniref:hypothetical protein n=1 Tax=Ewingella americana TaxID=41202 RepID=UPI0011272685|nr:hypothetical protein [Ewingella americana]